jgi:hypothetical protein
LEREKERDVQDEYTVQYGGYIDMEMGESDLAEVSSW